MILMTLNLTLSGTVLMIIHQNKGYEYHGMLIYVVAMYTFYVAIHAVISVIKYRKHQSPVMSTAKIISLSAALVSMLSLETAMLAQWCRYGRGTKADDVCRYRGWRQRLGCEDVALHHHPRLRGDTQADL